MSGILRFILSALTSVVRRLEQLLGPAIAPDITIARVRPGMGWPGTILTIDGTGFSDSLDGNIVGDAAARGVERITMRCAKCGAENREGRRFCAKCAAPLARLYPQCGASNEPGEDFCGECAAALGKPTASPVKSSDQPIPADLGNETGRNGTSV